MDAVAKEAATATAKGDQVDTNASGAGKVGDKVDSVVALKEGDQFGAF